MTKNKNYDSNLGEILYGSVIGAGKLVGDFLEGVLALPIVSFMVPTVVRSFKDEFKEAHEKEESPISGKSLKNFWINNPIKGIGAFTGGILIGNYADEAYHFVSEHPYTLAAPLVTNLLSAGYERYRTDKMKKDLEEKLE